MRVLSILSLVTAACAAAVGPQENSTLATTIPSPSNHTNVLMHAYSSPPVAIDKGPHWPLPAEKIDCDTTYAAHNRYAFKWAVIRIQVEWIREDGPRYWQLLAGTPNGHLVRVGCCHEASFNLVAQGKDENGNPTPLKKTLMISGDEITTMALAVADFCEAAGRSKGRAWSKNRDFTVEIFYDNHKCGRKCWQGD